MSGREGSNTHRTENPSSLARPAGTISGAMDSKIARCLLISKVLVADGIMTENERAFLNHYMDQLGLDDAEREQVVSLEGWDEAEPIVKAMSTEEKHAVLDAASNAALADGTLSPLELGAVKRIATALGLE